MSTLIAEIRTSGSNGAEVGFTTTHTSRSTPQSEKPTEPRRSIARSALIANSLLGEGIGESEG